MLDFRKIIPKRQNKLAIRECYLSFNHIYHRIALVSDSPNFILIQQFTPNSSLSDEMSKKSNKISVYNYYFQVPDNSTYTASTTRFKHHNLDKLVRFFKVKFLGKNFYFL